MKAARDMEVEMESPRKTQTKALEISWIGTCFSYRWRHTRMQGLGPFHVALGRKVELKSDPKERMNLQL